MALSNVPPCNIDDIQSWWEVPGIAHFCSLFRVAFNLLDFDIEELEEALLTDGTEFNGSSLLQDLIVRLLSGCLGHNDISTFNYQMFLRRLFRVKCKEEGRENPFNTDMDFQFLPLRTKVEILHALCDFRLDADDVIDVLKNLDSDSLRVHPLGHDENRAAYWYFYGTRLYKEEYPKKRKKKKELDKNKVKKKRKDDCSSEEESEEEYQLGTGTWSVMCYTEDDWQKLADTMAGSTCKDERVLYTVLSEDFLPEIPRLFEEKERLQKKRLMENQPRRQSRRIEKLKTQKEQDVQPKSRREKYFDKERGLRKIKKIKKDKKRQDDDKEERTRSKSLSSEDVSSDYSIRLPTGRQTNNSLSSLATSANVVIKSAIPTFRSTSLFRRTREDLMTGMYKILDKLKAHDNSWPFREPVEEAYAPKYYAVIAKPMDLKTMEDKLDNGEYGSLQEFRSDFQLIVDNCRQYNGSGNEYTEMAVNLQQLFETSVIRYLESDDHSSDNDMPRLTDNRLVDENDLDDDSLGSSFTPPLNGPQRSPSLSSISNGTISDNSQKMFQDKNEFQYEHQSRSRKKQKRKKKQYKDDTSSSDEDGLSSLEQRPRPARKAKEKLSSNDKKDESNSKSSRDEDTSNERKQRSLETSLERPRPRINYNEQYSSQSSLFSDSSDDSFENRLKGKLANKKPVKRAGIIKNLDIINALEIVSEEVTKDINKWLDDTPKFSDLSSNSNSPLHVPFPEDMDKIETEYRRRMHLDRPMRPRDRFSNELHRRRLFKEQMGLKRRRGEIQRTIDRLQPGKSKGNLLSKENLQDASNTEPKPAVIDENAPKISLGKVLETDVLGLGISENKKDSDDDCTQDKLIIEEDLDTKEIKEVKEIIEEEKIEIKEKSDLKKEKPTPNLSAWFKAFGAPKAQPVKKKTEEDIQKKEEDLEDKKSPEVPARRQRKASTGSSVSERSSFSQEPFDVNSPRPIDEPYLSPQQDPKYQHPPINGTIKVGFYQDTCFQRGTSEKSGSPRDLPSCSPRDLPSVSPRYCSPRNTPIRDYPNASYCSPRNPISPNDYQSSPRDIQSPLHYTENAVYRYRPSSPRPMSPREEPKDYYTTPRSPAPLYGGVPPYPSHLYYDTSKQLEYRVEKPIHPLKKRAYNEVDDSISPKTGGSFTPTREAMEQERTFTPTPGRMPGPSQPLRIPDPSLTMGIPHHPLQQHIMETYAEERNLSSPYYQGETSYKPQQRLYQQNFIENYDRNDKSPNQDHQVINYVNRSVTPVDLPSPNSPLNYSNANIELRNINSKEDIRETTIVNPSAMSFGNVTTRELNKSPLSYNRIGEMMPPKATFNRPLPDLVNYNNQDIGKIGVPLGYNQPDLMTKINYGPMDLMQPRYNYELMHPKTSVYNHPIPEYMNKSHQYPIQSNFNRTIPEIMQSKVAEIQNRELYRNKTETKKKSRKKKVATSESSGFQQYIGPTTSEPIKTGVPGSAFNFGPQLKEGFTTYLDDMRSPYYQHSDTPNTKTTPAPSYFLGHPPTRPATYPHPFMNPAQYQQLLGRHPEELLRPVVLQHGLIPPPAGYPPGYIMHDPMNRHSWL